MKSALYILLASSLLFVCYLGTAESFNPNFPQQHAGHPLLESPHFNPIVERADFVYVANTQMDTVDVIRKVDGKIIEHIPVGVDPVSLAIRPGSSEIWVSNHVSDSINIIDVDPASKSYHSVVATIQEFDEQKRTLFDEPVGIAFANNEKAYVALSSTNKIAVIDANNRTIIKKIKIAAQDPRAIVVRDNLLFVFPFESGNQTQLSGGFNTTSSTNNLVTFDAFHHFVKLVPPNSLSLGYAEDLIRHPNQPDKDLFVFDTETDTLIGTYESLGTLLYGATVDEQLNVYIAQTDARNHVNGRAGTLKHSLKELDNRPYLNRISKISMKKFDAGGSPAKAFIDLEPMPPEFPKKGEALATPHSVTTLDNGKYLIATAAGSNVVFVLDTSSSKIVARADVSAGPVGIAIEKSSSSLHNIWVYNAYENSVTHLVFDSAQLTLKTKLETFLEDSISTTVKDGRKYFHSAKLSSSGTFSCASCHPNANIDQLLWVLDTPIVSGGKQVQPRTTMPIRGIRDTEPFHWDGTLGDPYGGINATSTTLSKRPSCKSEETTNCIEQLISQNLATTMSTKIATSNQANSFDKTIIRALATYSLSVSYPPAPQRPLNNRVTDRAKKGFELFHVEGDQNPKMSNPNICGNCHRMPFMTSTNTPINGMDAVTWRGAYDRHLILPQGRMNIIDFPWIKKISETGREEFDIWRLTWSGSTGPRTDFDPVWNMVIEGSTGFSGAFARQITLDQRTVKSNNLLEILDDLEDSARQGMVVLECNGVLLLGGTPRKSRFQFFVNDLTSGYISEHSGSAIFSRNDIVELAEKGQFVGTFIARHGEKSDLFTAPQPALWTSGPMALQRGKQIFPTLNAKTKTMSVSGMHFKEDASIFVNGKLVKGAIVKKKEAEIMITLNELPSKGMHLLQVQSPQGRMSNDFIFYVR